MHDEDTAAGGGPLSGKVLEYDRIVRRVVRAAKEPGFSPAQWAPLADLVAVGEFERVGIWREVMNWPEYAEFLTKFATAKGFDSKLRRISELPGLVYLELEEHHIRGGNVNVVNSMNVFEFNGEGKIRRLDVYVQGHVEPSVPMKATN
ncbi:MAG: hypothetical protein ACLQRH_07240 [Acidimicrobiales bacterium]